MINEKISMNNIEEWVRNRFKNLSLPNHKYPVSYGIYDSERKAQHERFIHFHKVYWEKSSADLQSDKKTLSKQLEGERRLIYAEAGRTIAQAQKVLSKENYEAFKDEIICWILARSKKQNSEKVAYGLMAIKKLNENDFYGIDLSQDLCIRLENLNQARINWINTYEKFQVVKASLKAKANISDLYYLPYDSLSLMEDKEGNLGLKSLWNSSIVKKEIDKSKNKSKREIDKVETTRHSDKRKKHGEKEAIKEFWNKYKGDYLTDEYKFHSSGYYNKNKIAEQVKKDGDFTSHPDTIKDHAKFGDL